MTTITHLRRLMEEATPGRSTRLLALTGGMAGECLLEFGDPTNGGRSIQIRKADALLDEAMYAVLPAMLGLAEAAKAVLAPITPDDEQRPNILGERLTKLDKALAALAGEGS